MLDASRMLSLAMITPLKWTPVVRLLVVALVGAVFGIVTAKCGWFLITWALVSAGVIAGGYRIFTAIGSLAKFFNLFWGWADYKRKDWSSAPYKRGYAS